MELLLQNMLKKKKDYDKTIYLISVTKRNDFALSKCSGKPSQINTATQTTITRTSYQHYMYTNNIKPYKTLLCVSKGYNRMGHKSVRVRRDNECQTLCK